MTSPKPMGRCEACNIDMLLYSLPAHRRTKAHLRAIGELAPKPPKPEKKANGRPRIYDEPWWKRNPEYFKSKTWHCDLCDKTVPYTASTTHRGTKAHMTRLLASIKQAGADPATCVECLD